MTNALLGLIEKARLAGYKSLKSLTRQNNYRSKAVLGREGFIQEGQVEITPGKFYDKFILNL